MNKPTAEQIDALLPQTQCGLCGYNGCRPYAEAIVDQNEAINLCPPGGSCTLKSLGELLGQDPTPYLEDMREKEKPTLLAVIREDECIGCTKCIQACPTDAIIGMAKKMHTVITDACTGCELCVEPCPVDCIDMQVIHDRLPLEKKRIANTWRERFNTHNARLTRLEEEKRNKYQKGKLDSLDRKQTVSARKQAIADALARVKAKKESHE